jgi:hypothetical protein
MDAVTLNPYNQTVVEYNGAGSISTPTSKRFPGYAN